MPGRRSKLPKKGDKKLSANFLREMSERLDRFDKVSTTFGLSTGPAGIGFPLFDQDPPPGIIMCSHGFQPAAFGGEFGHYPSSDLAISYGNRPADITTRRRLYYRTVNQVGYKHKAAPGPPSSLASPPGNLPGVGYLVSVSDDEEPFIRNVLLANPFDLPLDRGYCYAIPNNINSETFDINDPHYLILQPLGPNPWGASIHHMFFANPPENTWRVFHDERKFLKGSVSGALAGNGHWAIPGYGDVFLPFPGNYKVTFGATARGPGEYTLEDTYEADVNLHKHKYRSFSTPTLDLKLFMNYEPGTALDLVPWGSSEPEVLSIPLPSGTYAGEFSSQLYTSEKTIIIENNADGFHGGSYMRLSLAAYTYLNTASEGFDLSTHYAQIRRAWIVIEPVCQGGRFGGGAQQYPTGYVWPAGGLFQWYGGGPAPPAFNESGVLI